MAPKKSFILQMFEQCLESVVTVICNICSAKVSRGTLGNMGTPGMRQHGQRNHLIKYKEVEKKAKESVLPPPHDAPLSLQKQKAVARQASLEESLDSSKSLLWPMSSAKHQGVMIIKLICADFQPFSIVDSPGFFQLVAHLEPRFQMPCRSTIRRKIDPIFQKIRQKVQEQVDGANFVATTSDIWTDSTSNYTFISLTGGC